MAAVMNLPLGGQPTKMNPHQKQQHIRTPEQHRKASHASASEMMTGSDWAEMASMGVSKAKSTAHHPPQRNTASADEKVKARATSGVNLTQHWVKHGRGSVRPLRGSVAASGPG